MGWMPGCPQDPGVFHGTLDPRAVVLHRTYGRWPGDYSVGLQGIFHFLLGKAEGRWVQFAPTEIVQYHCNGANFRAVGIEVEGTNDDALTDWQVARLGDVLRWLHSEHNIPLTYLEPGSVPPASVSVNHTNFTGLISHVSVATDDNSSQHTDLVTADTVAKAIGSSSSPGGTFTVGQMEDIAQWEKDTRVVVNAFTEEQIQYLKGEIAKGLQDTEARIIAALKSEK